MNNKIWLGDEKAHMHTVNHKMALTTDPSVRFDAYVETYDGSHLNGAEILLNTTLPELAKVIAAEEEMCMKCQLLWRVASITLAVLSSSISPGVLLAKSLPSTLMRQ